MRRGEGQYDPDPSLWSRPGREGGHGDEEAERCGSRADHRISIPQFSIPHPSPSPNPSPSPRLSTAHTIRNRDVFQCSVLSSVFGAVSHRVGENKDHASCRTREGGRRSVRCIKGSKPSLQCRCRTSQEDKAAGVFVSFFVDTLLPGS